MGKQLTRVHYEELQAADLKGEGSTLLVASSEHWLQDVLLSPSVAVPPGNMEAPACNMHVAVICCTSALWEHSL